MHGAAGMKEKKVLPKTYCRYLDLASFIFVFPIAREEEKESGTDRFLR